MTPHSKPLSILYFALIHLKAKENFKPQFTATMTALKLDSEKFFLIFDTFFRNLKLLKRCSETAENKIIRTSAVLLHSLQCAR